MKSGKCAALLLLLVTGALVCLGLLGCGTTSQLYVTKPLSADLSKYEAATVVVRGRGGLMAKATATLKQMIVERLEKADVFRRVGRDGDVIIKATIQNMADGKELTRDMSLSGQAEATVEVKITEADGSPLAHVTAEATSPREDEKDRPELRVLRAVADLIVRHIKDHSGSASNQSKTAEQGRKKPG